jgi:general secretion pathway protein F
VCRRFFDAGCLHVPWLGEVIRQAEVARFARSLGTAIGSGVPLLTGVRLVKEVIGNSRIAEDIEAVSVSLEQGRSMVEPLRDSPVWPELAAQLVEVGETSGQLDSMLVKIADIYDREVQTTIKRFLVILEPALILGLGG